MVDSTYYFKKPNETVDQYNARITGATSGVNLASYKTPTTPAQTASPSIASIYGTTSPIDTSFNDIGSYYQTQANKTVDEAAIRKAVMDNLQREIDATNSVFARKLLEAKQVGAGRLGQTTAINARRGLAGSDFGKANTDTQENANQDVYNSIEAERGAALAALYSNGENTVRSELEAQTAARNQGADKYLSWLKDSEARRTNRTNSAAAAALAAGIDLTTATPEDLAKLANSYGADQNAILAAYREAKQKQNADALAAQTNQAELDYKKAQTENLGASSRYQTIGDGSMLYDTKTGQVVANNPKTFAPSDGGGTAAPGENPQLYSGLSSKTATAVRGIVSQFKTEPVVQNFAVVQEGNNFASSIQNTTKNPADDQALIYALAKALDPGSVVREGEYATAQKYSQSWISAYGKGVSQALAGTGFLSTQARENIKKVIASKYVASKKSYDNLYQQYTTGVNNLTGRSDGQMFLRDYTTPQTQDTTNDPLGIL